MGPTDDELTDDELVSAVLDGEATAAQIDAVAADPRLSSRLEDFGRLHDLHVRSALADVGSSAPNADDRVTAALAAASAPATDGPDVPGATVVSVVGRRTPRWLTVAGAAAAVLLVLGGLGLAVRGGSGSDDSSASGVADSLERSEAADGGAEGGLSPSEATGLATTTIPAPTAVPPQSVDAESGTSDAASSAPSTDEQFRASLPWFGDFATVEQLLAAITPEVRAGWPVIDAALSPCAVDGAATVQVAGATVAGTPVIVVADGDRITVYDQATCRPLT